MSDLFDDIYFIAGEKLFAGDRVNVGSEGTLMRATDPLKVGFNVHRDFEKGERVYGRFSMTTAPTPGIRCYVCKRIIEDGDLFSAAHANCDMRTSGLRRMESAALSLARAREILEEAGFTLEDESGRMYVTHGDFGKGVQHVRYFSADSTCSLDGEYTTDQLEALAVWMRHHAKRGV